MYFVAIFKQHAIKDVIFIVASYVNTSYVR